MAIFQSCRHSFLGAAMSKVNFLGLQCLGELGKSLVSKLHVALRCHSVFSGVLGIRGCWTWCGAHWFPAGTSVELRGDSQTELTAQQTLMLGLFKLRLSPRSVCTQWVTSVCCDFGRSRTPWSWGTEQVPGGPKDAAGCLQAPLSMMDQLARLTRSLLGLLTVHLVAVSFYYHICLFFVRTETVSCREQTFVAIWKHLAPSWC